MEETFDHSWEDGFHMTGPVGWSSISYSKIYRNTQGFPYQLNKHMKKSKQIAQFVCGMSRGEETGKECFFMVYLIYKHSLN